MEPKYELFINPRVSTILKESFSDLPSAAILSLCLLLINKVDGGDKQTACRMLDAMKVVYDNAVIMPHVSEEKIKE